MGQSWPLFEPFHFWRYSRSNRPLRILKRRFAGFEGTGDYYVSIERKSDKGNFYLFSFRFFLLSRFLFLLAFPFSIFAFPLSEGKDNKEKKEIPLVKALAAPLRILKRRSPDLNRGTLSFRFPPSLSFSYLISSSWSFLPLPSAAGTFEPRERRFKI